MSTIRPAAPLTMDSVQSTIFMQFSAMSSQPAIGVPAQRMYWLGALGNASRIAATSPNPFVSYIRGGDCNLRRADKILQGVRSQMAVAGIRLPDMQSGLAANAARFRAEAVMGGDASTSMTGVAGAGSDDDVEIARYVVDAFLRSERLTHKFLLAMLERSYVAHISHHDAQVARMQKIALSRKVPSDATYPRYFEDAHPQLIRLLEEAIAELSGGRCVYSDRCITGIVDHLKQQSCAREGIHFRIANQAQVKRGLRLVQQVSEYSAFQLLCLLIQIRDADVDPVLVEDLWRAREGRVISTEIAMSAGVGVSDIFEASRLIGNIDTVHVNFETVLALAIREHPTVKPKAISLWLRRRMLHLARVMGAPPSECDEAIDRLRELEANPPGDNVVPIH